MILGIFNSIHVTKCSDHTVNRHKGICGNLKIVQNAHFRPFNVNVGQRDNDMIGIVLTQELVVGGSGGCYQQLLRQAC